MSAVHVLQKAFKEIQAGEVLVRKGNAAWEGEYRICKLIGSPIWIGFGSTRHYGGAHFLGLTLFLTGEDAEKNCDPIFCAYCNENDESPKVILNFHFKEKEVSFGSGPIAIALLISELERQGAGAACTD